MRRHINLIKYYKYLHLMTMTPHHDESSWYSTTLVHKHTYIWRVIIYQLWPNVTYNNKIIIPFEGNNNMVYTI